MQPNNYELEFLPLFYQDLEEIVDYITFKLKNPDAAEHLVDDVFAAIDERLSNAESFEPYKALMEFHFIYYRINVKNYVVFYVVKKDIPGKKIMEVRRILYNKRNLADII